MLVNERRVLAEQLISKYSLSLSLSQFSSSPVYFVYTDSTGRSLYFQSKPASQTAEGGSREEGKERLSEPRIDQKNKTTHVWSSFLKKGLLLVYYNIQNQ